MPVKVGGACTVCEKYTENIIKEPNICKDLLLCNECKKQFERCKGCGGHYYPQELGEGYCKNCR